MLVKEILTNFRFIGNDNLNVVDKMPDLAGILELIYGFHKFSVDEFRLICQISQLTCPFTNTFCHMV